MKVIFLDIDGVLNNKWSRSRCDGYIGIDKAKVALLKIIVETTGANIVLSSTWRLGYAKGGGSLQHHIKYLKRKLQQFQLEVYDVTPDLGRMGFLRGQEIKKWISEQIEPVTNIVILDDEEFDFEKEGLYKYLVHTSWNDKNGGLNQSHVDNAIYILGERYDG